MSSSITINGVTITGSSINISRNVITVDGKRVELNPNDKTINIQVQGNIDSIKADVCETITVTGSAGQVSTGSGDVKCGAVTSNVSAGSGDIDVKGDVGGNVTTGSGDVSCGAVQGSVKTGSGDINHR